MAIKGDETLMRGLISMASLAANSHKAGQADSRCRLFHSMTYLGAVSQLRLDMLDIFTSWIGRSLRRLVSLSGTMAVGDPVARNPLNLLPWVLS